MKMKRSIRPLLFVLTLLVVPTLHADNLYDERSFRPLVADIRAREVGDPVTVLIVENSSAESRANTSEDAKFSLNAGIKDATGPASAGASATVDGKRASSTHAMAKPTLKATSRGSTRGKIVPRHFRHNHLLWG